MTRAPRSSYVSDPENPELPPVESEAARLYFGALARQERSFGSSREGRAPLNSGYYWGESPGARLSMPVATSSAVHGACWACSVSIISSCALLGTTLFEPTLWVA